MKIRVCCYSLASIAFLADERKSVDILFPRSGRLNRIIIPLEYGTNFSDIIVEVDRPNSVPALFVASPSGLSFREDPAPETFDGKVICYECNKLDCSNDEHDHVQNFNILRGHTLFYEFGHILRLTATAKQDSLFMVAVTCFESS